MIETGPTGRDGPVGPAQFKSCRDPTCGRGAVGVDVRWAFKEWLRVTRDEMPIVSDVLEVVAWACRPIAHLFRRCSRADGSRADGGKPSEILSLPDRLEDELRDHILASMPADPTGELTGRSTADLMFVYGNWRSRFIPARPRTVHVSAELASSPKFGEHTDVIAAISEKLEHGHDVGPHLSRRVTVAYEPYANRAAALQGRKDLDLMIADWGIHHLHLSTNLDGDGFVRRTGDLLFVAVHADDVYLIDILSHGGWTEVALIEIAVRNWPDAGIAFPLAGVAGLAHQPTPDERRAIRNAGVVAMFEIDGKVFTPPGQSTAGTAIRVTMAANTALTGLRQLREALTANPNVLDDDLVAAGVIVELPGIWVPMIDADEGYFGVVETKTRTFFPVGDLPV